MTSEHIRKVIEFMNRESVKNRTKEEIIKEWQEVGLLDSNGNYTAPYRNLGRRIDECTRKAKEE
ncbi:hypothetical protein L3C95_22655 [Chitinophaga filiformis]|uniref:hypothetical protein n=1 Tax=Chitinophaga filiformis TaxID=104663 RepID=UPI001F354FB1|nr:hypothetical protein [Chitinophaga filiformis]MCF6405717.1 hypothetical protein [Chitinophaga filiformis]